MPTPPEGVGIDPGTLNSKNSVTAVSMSDEEEMSDLPSIHRNDLETQASNSTPEVGTSQSQPKLYNLLSDKYNSNLFYVYMESTDKSNLGRLHALKVGHILHKKLSVNNIIEIKSIGKNRIRVQLGSMLDANKLVMNELLVNENIRAYIPNHILEIKGLIRGIDTFFDTDYLRENIVSSSKIIDITRMKKKTVINGEVTLINKQSVIISFEGNQLPKKVTINSVSCPVERFYGRVTQCYNCLRYGHISKQCRSSKQLCISCSQEKLDNHSCTISDICCVHCHSSGHKSNSKDCPVYKKQVSLKKIMAEMSISFREAEAYLNNSYSAQVTSNRFNLLADENINTEFPPLPNKSKTTCNPRNLSSSQPTVSKSECHFNRIPQNFSQQERSLSISSNDNRKKRKLPPVSPTAPMFPFRFSSGTPLPPSQHHPSYIFSAEKDKLLNCVAIFVTEFLNKVVTSDSKNINIDSVKQDISILLGKNFSNCKIQSHK